VPAITNVASSHCNHTVNDQSLVGGAESRGGGDGFPAGGQATECWGTDLLELGWSGDVEVGLDSGGNEGEGDNKGLCEHVEDL
jgi:hypothetical protein